MNKNWIVLLVVEVLWALLLIPSINCISTPYIKFGFLITYCAGAIFILTVRTKWPFDWVNYIPDHPSGQFYPSPGSTRIQWSVTQALGEAGFYSLNTDVISFASGDIEDAKLNSMFHAALIGNPRFTLRDHFAFVALLKSQKHRPPIKLRY